MPELLNTKQAAERLNLSPLTLTEYAREKRLEALKVGREWIFPEQSVEAFKATREAEKAAKATKGA